MANIVVEKTLPVSPDALWELVKDFSVAGMAQMRADVPRLGLSTPLERGGTMFDLAGRGLEIAMEGLRARARPGAINTDETEYLGTLQGTIASGRTPAEALLERYYNDWDQSVDQIYTELAY